MIDQSNSYLLKTIFRPGILYTVLMFFSFQACVPPRQFAEFEEQHTECIEKREHLKAKNEFLTVENTELKAKLNGLENEVDELVQDSINKNEALARMTIEYQNLQDRYTKLREAQESLKTGSARETRKLLSELQAAQDDLQRRENDLRALELELQDKRKDLEAIQTKMENQQARLVELEQILYKQDSIMNALRQKVSAALLGFEGQGLTVTRKNGNVYVSLEEKLLFKSGSSEIGASGQQALKQLAQVLEQNKDIHVMIEGHTDDVPYISTGPIKDNWDLSVKRATAVVRILLEHSSIKPQRLTAAGRGEYLPVDPAKTPQARARNRRTEIILTPDLNELYRLFSE